MRTLDVRLSFPEKILQFGATGAYLCGVAAALPMLPSWTDLARVLAGWLVAVALLGSVWLPGLGSDQTVAPPRIGLGPASGLRVRAWAHRLGEIVPSGGAAASLVAILLAVVLAVLLGTGTTLILFSALAVLGGHILLRGLWPPSVGAIRSILEILVPGLIGWMAIAGPKSMAASVALVSGPMAQSIWWIQHNWLVPGVFVAFTLVHYGATAVRRRERLIVLRRINVFGYLLAIAMLAVVARPFHAGTVALLFVIQWPFQAAFQSGYVRWHWKSVQLIALLAMLVAALGARNLP